MSKNREDLYRRLAQSRRLAAQPHDVLTRERLDALVGDLEKQIAAAEANDTDDQSNR